MGRYKKDFAELIIIRSGRKMFDKLLIRIFPNVFKRFVSMHLGRAHEVMEINNIALHSIDYYVGADLKLPGFKKRFA